MMLRLEMIETAAGALTASPAGRPAGADPGASSCVTLPRMVRVPGGLGGPAPTGWWKDALAEAAQDL